MRRGRFDGAALEIAPVPQKDGISCGYCAVKSVYRYYGIGCRRLRERLGTDHGFLPPFPGRGRVEDFLDGMDICGFRYSDMCGTYAADIFAVLHGDGLDVGAMPGYDAGTADKLRKHVASGHPALALANWNHWIVISGAGKRGVMISDSCVRKPYFRTHIWCGANIAGVMPVRKRRGNAHACGTVLEYLRGHMFVLRMGVAELPRIWADLSA